MAAALVPVFELFGITALAVTSTVLIVNGVKMSIEKAKELLEELKKKRCNCKGLCHIDLRNKEGPSGFFKKHCIKCSNRKKAYEAAANHMGYHTPIEHSGHFHPTDGNGRKIPSYHYCYPPF